MGRKKYTEEHINYLRKISPGRYNDEVTRMFNKKFGMSATGAAISTLRVRHGIRLGVSKARKQYTDEQLDYLKELSAQGLFNTEITRQFNQKFGTDKTETAIKSMRSKYGFKTSARYYWEEGHAPWNKGKKGVSYEGMKATQFKKGNLPQTWVPVGTESLTRDGYIRVKVHDVRGGMSRKGWVEKHVLVWEEHHGRPVPDGHAVIFGDGNKRNFNPDNLILVTRAQLCRMNQLGLIYDDTDLTKTGAIIAEIRNRIGERRREKKRNNVEEVPN